MKKYILLTFVMILCFSVMYGKSKENKYLKQQRENYTQEAVLEKIILFFYKKEQSKIENLYYHRILIINRAKINFEVYHYLE